MKRVNILLVLTVMFSLTVCAVKKPTKAKPVKKAAAAAVAKDTMAIIIDKAKAGDAAAQNTLGVWYYTGKDSLKQDYKQALQWWARSAQQDNADAIGNMAMCYQLGQGSKRDSTLAMTLYKKAIEKGNKAIIPQHEQIVKNTNSLFSSLLLIDCYSKGIGVKRDLKKVVEYRECAAKAGDVDSQYAFALSLMNGKQADKAVYWFKKASDKGNVGATYYYGNLMFNGMGIEQDKQKGIQYLTQAAEKGFDMAYSRLAQICYDGDGVTQDYKKAFEFAKRGAGKNNSAKWILAMCYINGYGTAQDYYLGTQWLVDAFSTHGEKIAKFLEDDNDGTYSQYLYGLREYFINKDYAKAITFFTKVDKAKVAEGKTMLGVCTGNRNYDKKNEKKAVKYLEKASVSSMAACYNLSSMYETGTGCKEDKAKALELLKKAADGGVAFAQCKLGDMYMSGTGVPLDYSQAAKYYLMAEAQNRLTSSSAKKLAECYDKKISVLPDLDKAKERAAALAKHKDNNSLISFLKRIK